MGGYSLQIYILHIVLLSLPISRDGLKTSSVFVIIIYALIVLIGLKDLLDKVNKFKDYKIPIW